MRIGFSEAMRKVLDREAADWTAKNAPGLLPPSISWDGGANSDPVANLHSAIANTRLVSDPLILSAPNYEVLKIKSATWTSEMGPFIRGRRSAKYVRRFEPPRAVVEGTERVPRTHRESALAASIFAHESRRWRMGKRSHPEADECIERARVLCGE